MKNLSYPIQAFLLLLCCALYGVTVMAQDAYVTLDGTVRDLATGKALAYVNVSVPGTHISTVTNSDGGFILKTARKPSVIVFSHVGYRTYRYAVQDQLTRLKVSMKPSAITLAEVLVDAGEGCSILYAAMERIPQNFGKVPELFRGFYRETTQRGRRYIYVAEAVINMYKTDYAKMNHYLDRVEIDKARRMISTKQSDTLGAKIMGGPVLPIYIDYVKDPAFLFNDVDLDNYNVSVDIPTSINDRPQIVLAFTPRRIVEDALYFGKVYIDRATLAFSRIELQLDMKDKEKATRCMLVKKPQGVRFKPKEMSLLVNYKRDEDGISRISYVRSMSKFNCDWKRKLFHSGYTVTAEMVVTDQYPQDQVHPIQGRSSFGPKSSLYDKVESFDAPDFWGKDNIIEPTESLEGAIEKLKKKLRDQ
ncbi:MAG TPA: hypothetical protein DIS88_10055 [Prevotella sp.]|nr:hypothetical protein [Prevotella sp.]